MGPNTPLPLEKKKLVISITKLEGPAEMETVHLYDMGVGEMLGSDMIEGQMMEGDTKESERGRR